ncbi:MAG TPA: hypothetical protein DCL48_07880 [Alphaproteobacteria bacterium]|nr:hypothetical protein [Alphaproteobacteria bacterium]
MIVLRTPVVDAKRALEGELSFVEDDLEDVIKNVVPDGPRKPELLRDLDRLLLLRADVRSSADAAATKEKASTEKFSSRDDRGFEEPPIQWAPVFDNKNNDVVQNLYKMICDKEQGTFGLFSLKLISYRVYSYPGGPRGQPVFGVLPSSVRKQWLQEFKTAREAPKDSLVTCEAARQLSDRQYDFLLRASDEADAWAIEQKEFEERAITAEWEFAAEAAKKLQERPKP